jgi:hypothetical protein
MASFSFIPASKLIELVQSANKTGAMYVRIMSASKLALGPDPMKPTVLIDLSKETAGPYNEGNEGKANDSDTKAQTGSAKITRRSGEYWFEIKGHPKDVGSLRELLGQGLLEIEAQCPGTLDKLSHIKLKTKRIVARDKKMLFDTEHLVDDHSKQLKNGWWYGINNSADETTAWLRRACDCAGLKWGKDFRTNLTTIDEDIFAPDAKPQATTSAP